MASGYKVQWTAHALSELSNTIAYLEDNWTEKELIKFANAIDHTIEIISRHPEIYPASDRHKNIRKAVVDKNNTIYYRIDNETVQYYLYLAPGKILKKGDSPSFSPIQSGRARPIAWHPLHGARCTAPMN